MLTVFPPFLESTQNLVRYLQNLKVRYDTLMIYSKANLAVTAKKYDEAEQLYIEAIGKGDQESLIGLGNLYLANKKYANANKLFLAIYALGDHSDNIFMQIAKAFESQKKYDEELDFFTNALAKDPLCLICHAFIGNALYFTKKYINAAKNYDLALENGYYFIISNYLDLNISTGAIDEAKNLAEELGKKGQKISAEDLARVYFEAQDWREAKKYLIKCDQTNISTISRLLITATFLKATEEVQRYFEQISSMSKELKYVKLYAQYMFEAKKYDRAIPHLKILGEEHKDVESLIMLGTIYESMKDFEQANKYYLEAILLGSVECLYNLGLMQVKNNMRDLGKRYLDEGSKKGLVNATLLAGDVYAEENKVREALKYYTTALRQEIPDDLIVPTKLKIGIIYQATGEISKAISVFNELKEYNTTAKFNLANIYTDQKKYEMAKTLYLQLDPTKLDDPQHIYLINYAKILIIQRFYAKAEEIITPLVQQQVAAAYVLAAELFANKEDLVKANQFLSLAIGATKGKKLGEVYWITGNIIFRFTEFNDLLNSDFTKVIEAYKNAVANNYQEAYYELGEIYFWQGKYNEAKQHFTNSLGFVTDSKLINAHIALADIARFEKNEPEIVSNLLQVIKLADYSVFPAIARLFRSRIDEALIEFKPDIYTNPAYAIILGKVYADSRDLKSAEFYLTAALKNNFKYALFELALMYEQSNPQKSAELLNQAVTNNIAYACNYLGMQQEAQEKYKSAYITFTKSASLNNPEGILHVATLYEKINKLEKAIEFYNAAINVINHNRLKLIYFNLGVIYSKIKVVDKSLAYFLRAYWYGNPTALYNLIIIYYELKNTENAYKYAKLALEQIKVLKDDQYKKIIGPDYTNVMFIIGTIFYNNKEFATALDLYKKHIGMYTPAQQLEVADKYFVANETDTAVELYTQHFNNFNLDQKTEIGNKLFSINRTDNAYDFYQRIMTDVNNDTRLIIFSKFLSVQQPDKAYQLLMLCYKLMDTASLLKTVTIFFNANQHKYARDLTALAYAKFDGKSAITITNMFTQANEHDTAYQLVNLIYPHLDPQSIIMLISILFHANQIDHAIELYNKNLQKFKSSEQIAFANLFFDKGDMSKAHDLYFKALINAQHQDTIFIMTRLGKIYYDVGNWKDAIILFEKIINYADTQLLKFIGWYLGISYMCDNRSEKCLNLANKYFTLFPGNYANAAQLYKQWSSLAQNSSRTNNSQIVVTSDNKNTIINSTLNKSMQKNTIFDGI